MRDLEDILRRESQRELPESPPPGGFAQLRAQLQQPPVTSHRRWRLLAVVIICLCATVGAYWWPTERATPKQPTVTVNAGTTKDTAAAVLHPTTARPAATPAAPARVASPISSSARVERPTLLATMRPIATSLRSSPVELNVNTSSNTSASVGSPRATFVQQHGAAERPSSVLVSAEQHKPIEKNVVPSHLSRQTSAVYSPGVLLAPRANALAGYLREHPVNLSAVATPVQHQKRRPDWSEKPISKGWDISLSHYGRRGAPVDRFSLRYADNDLLNPGALPQAIVIENETRTLFYVGIVNYQFAERLDVGQLRLNRLTQSGLRFGLGLTFYREGRNTESAVRAIEATLPNAYLLVYNSKDDVLLGQLSVGFTFLRRKRLQPWLTVGLQIPLWQRFKGETNFLHAGNLNPVTEEVQVRNVFGSGVEVYPALEAGLQYRLSPRFSAGVNLGLVPSSNEDVRINPALGLEARYRL